MASPPAPRAGGALIAIAATLGAFIGMAKGESSIGFLIGLGIGIAAAVALWLRDRKYDRP